MSSLSDFALRGAAGGGTGSPRTSPMGLHHGVSDSCLPMPPSAGPVKVASRGKQEMQVCIVTFFNGWISYDQYFGNSSTVRFIHARMS